MSWIGAMYVVAGGAFGALCRYLSLEWVARYNLTGFPYGTFAVNILGSFLLGVWIAYAAHTLPPKMKDLHLLLAVGALGGFTTFSTFAWDTFDLLDRGAFVQTLIYVGGSVFLSVLALMGGMWFIRLLNA
ncbi:MAG: fluoride efflux transporter CrcB [Rickettsiales bacterium]|nr:fluoride efflux transporter CrcB [Rickettsiales bacterium]